MKLLKVTIDKDGAQELHDRLFDLVLYVAGDPSLEEEAISELTDLLDDTLKFEGLAGAVVELADGLVLREIAEFLLEHTRQALRWGTP